MKKISEAHIAAVKDFASNSPFNGLVGIKLTKLGPGTSQMMIDITKKTHNNPYGMIHGGAYASLIDATAYWAVYYDIPEGAELVSLDLSVDYLSTVKEGRVFANGRMIKAGRTIYLSEVQVVDENGKLLCYGKSKLMVIQGMHELNTTLPPKYEV